MKKKLTAEQKRALRRLGRALARYDEVFKIKKRPAAAEPKAEGACLAGRKGVN